MHFRMICDEGLEEVATLLVAIELLGMLPDQIWFLLLALMREPKGSYRTSLVQAGVVRIRERLRRAEPDVCFAEVDRSFWAFGAGMSADDILVQCS